MMQSAHHQTRSFQNASFVFIIFSLLLVLAACTKPTENAMHLNGKTMGTTYHITIAQPGDLINQRALQMQVDKLLQTVNQQMSTYIADSQISQFNALPPNEWMTVDTDFISVLNISIDLSKQSHGKFDITIGPLIELWGFGKNWHADVPSDEAIAKAMARTGWEQLQIDAQANRILKKIPLTLNVSAVAKGFGVDKVADYLEAQGLSNYLVEIGGEVRVKGLNPKQKAWKLGIEKPALQSSQQVQQVIQIKDQAVATSGDYRNYFEQDGQRYSHTIDPQSGRPVKHRIASVTVIAETAAAADGYATTLNVIGSIDEAMVLAENQQLAAYFILHTDDPEKPYTVRYSSAFKPYLKH